MEIHPTQLYLSSENTMRAEVTPVENDDGKRVPFCEPAVLAKIEG